jgi:hypothetical protein
MALQHLRSSTANKRPLPANMADGQVAVNTNTSSPGLFVKDSASGLLKIGPTHIGTTAPNLSPAAGGATGNTIGEQWLDTTGANPLLKVWDGSAWKTVQPVTTGTVVSTTDVGTITSTMILDETIANVDISTTAGIAHSKLASITAGNILLGNASNVPTATTVSGDITITSTGVTTVSNGAITNAKVSASAGIVDTKLATISTAGKVSNSATTATNGNTANAIVARDANGNFSAGTISASLNGNASTATNASTVTTNANLTGDVTSVGNATSIAAGVIVNADISASAAIADTKLATISTAGKVSNSATTATNGNTVNTIVARDASGNFSAGTISAALNGNASTATTLQNTRTINGTNFNGSANITTTSWGTARTLTIGSTGKSVDGSGNVSWTTEEVLPPSLRRYAQSISNWDLARENGWYMADGALNAPTTGWLLGFVECHNDLWVTQTVHQFTVDSSGNTGTWRRDRNNGTFGAWYRLRISEAELDGRYAQGNGTGASGTWGISITGNASTVTTNANLTGDVTSVGNATSIAAGVIVNADVSASAAIAGTKISPNFGSQTITTTGVISPALGTAAAPSIAFTGDLNTGIYSPGADQVAVATNGAGRLVIDATGNAVLGATGAKAQLHVYGTGQDTANLTDAGARGALLRLSDTQTTAGAGGGIIFSNSQGETANSVGFAAIKGLLTNGNSNTAGDLAFATRATAASTSLQERLRITSAGLVGIGTSSPNTALHVVNGEFTVSNGGNSADAGGSINFGITTFAAYSPMASVQGLLTNATGTELQGGLGFFTRPFAAAGQALTRRMTITNAGNVGIGTTSPAYPLEVARNNGVIGFIPDSVNGNTIRFGGVGGTANQLIFTGTSDLERARIDSSGRLLVGTSTSIIASTGVPGDLQVQTPNGFVSFGRYTNDNVGASLYFFKSRSATVGGQTIVQNGDSTGGILFEGSDGVQLRRNAAILGQIDGTPTASPASMPGRLVFSTTAAGASTPTERMRITNTGAINLNTTSGANINVGSGTQDGATFYVPGGTGGILQASNNNNIVAFFRRRGSDGSVIDFRRDTTPVGAISVTTTSTAYSTSSDYRLKENVVDLDGAIDRLKLLPVHRFNFIADPDTVVDGFIAHEAAEVVPECVTGTKDEVDEDGNPEYQGIDQSKLVPLLTAALQEAVAKIESLEARLTAAGI